MQFEFNNINNPYNQINADVLASITNENTNAAKSNISSIYNSAELNLDAAVLSISNKGNAKMSAMLSKSIRLRASYSDPNMTASQRLELSNSLHELRGEIQKIQIEGESGTVDSGVMTSADETDAVVFDDEMQDTDVSDETMDAEQLIAKSTDNILKYAEDSIQTQVLDRERILELI